jgi:hypothetical protein
VYWRFDDDVRVLTQFPILLNLDIISEDLCICCDVCKAIPIELPCFVDCSKLITRMYSYIVCVCVFVCVCVCMRICMYARMFMCVFIDRENCISLFTFLLVLN